MHTPISVRQEATLTIRMFGVGSLVHCMQPQACMSSIVDGLGMTRMVHVCVRRYPYTRTNSCLRRTFCSLQRVARDAMEEPWRGNSSHRGRRRAARSTIHRPRVRLAVADTLLLLRNHPPATHVNMYFKCDLLCSVRL